MKPFKLAFLLLLLPSLQIFAQPGTLDNTFNGTGKAILNFDPDQEEITAVRALPNGKIVACVSTVDFVAVQFVPNGSLDTSFGTGGKAAKHIANGCLATDLIVQPDGKILLAGEANFGGNTDFAMVRFDASGDIDSSFGTDGVVTTPIGPGSNDRVWAAALQNDGKIVLVGNTSGLGTNWMNICTVRYNSDGSLDTSFGVGGKLVTDFGFWNQMPSTVLLQPDGKIVVAGSMMDDWWIARFLSNGANDTTFAASGFRRIYSFPYDFCTALALQPDGKIIASGSFGNDFGLLRLNTNGDLDSAFGANGKVTTSFSSMANGEDVLLQPDGKILTVGYAGGTAADFALTRHLSDGTPDLSFGNAGIAQIDLGDNDLAISVSMQPDGKFVIGGSSGNGVNRQSAVIRVISGLNLGVVTFDREDFNALVYPNPLKENNILQFELKQTEILTISLVNAAGKLCRTFARNEKFDRGKHELPVRLGNELAAGSYFFILKNGKGQTAIKVIK